MSTKFIPILKFFTVATTLFVTMGFNSLNAKNLKSWEKCQKPEGSYRNTCKEIRIRQTNIHCVLHAKCQDIQKMFTTGSIEYNDAGYYWPLNSPTPKLHNLIKGKLSPE